MLGHFVSLRPADPLHARRARRATWHTPWISSLRLITRLNNTPSANMLGRWRGVYLSQPGWDQSTMNVSVTKYLVSIATVTLKGYTHVALL
jgi:hypothetical protein